MYDVIIVGAGPAGIFTALELVKKNHLKIIILEKGLDISKRVQLAQKKMFKKEPTAVVSGWGGAGAFSDGKLTLSTDIGGWLNEYIANKELDDLIDYVDRIYLEYGAPKKKHGLDKSKIDSLAQKAQLADLSLIPSHIRHLGTDRCAQILKEMAKYLEDRVDIRTKTEVTEILSNKGKVVGVKTRSGEEIKGNNVVVAPGRAGASWLLSEVRRLGLGVSNNAVDIGVRVEVPASVYDPFTSVLYEPKLVYYTRSFQDKIRTFCMNPYGEVTLEISEDLTTVNGHSYADKKTNNTNFALLVSTNFTEPFKEPIAYGKYIARLANLLGDGIIVQRLEDLKAGRRSTGERIDRSAVKPTLTKATPGDLSFVLPYRYISDILEMLEALDKVAPGTNDRNTLLYGVEVKFYSARVKLTPSLQTHIKNLYTIGDGAGITRGLVQSSASGVVVARNILKEKNCQE
ncbi:MAG: FAD-dependent oxidoreductase [Actinobacteria bacterium]|nr:MAG: FAD-dependent oxidoreductase [Actinomycetota bacterium]